MITLSCFILFSDPEIILQVSPTEAVGLEESCPDSVPYRNITLVCTATKPLEVVPELSVSWTHEGVSQEADELSQNSGSRQTRTIRLLEVNSSNAGTYMCTASIVLPDSPTVMENKTSMVYYRGKRVNQLFNAIFECFLTLHSCCCPIYCC